MSNAVSDPRSLSSEPPTGQTVGAEERPPETPLSLCLLIGSLEFGGAERQVLEMVRTFDRRVVRPIICSLSSRIPLAETLGEMRGIVHVVEKRGRFDVTAVLRVASLLRRHKIDALHTFLFDAEVIGRLAARLARVPVVISSERNTDYERPILHRVALGLTRPMFDVMVANSDAGKRFNIRTQSLTPSRIEVVYNGVDGDRFRPDREAGLAFRHRVGLPPMAPVVGMVGSYKRQKGHDVFLRMADRVRGQHPDARFLIVGGSVGKEHETRGYEKEIRDLCLSLDLTSQCVFVGNQIDMRAVYNACDITALLSRREGTPNTVLESMSCGVPAVVADVADNALIVRNRETGFVVPVEDAATAALRVSELLDNDELRRSCGAAARRDMRERFSPRAATRQLERIYTRCLAEKSPA